MAPIRRLRHIGDVDVFEYLAHSERFGDVGQQVKSPGKNLSVLSERMTDHRRANTGRRPQCHSCLARIALHEFFR
jgi:hypothetical protein